MNGQDVHLSATAEAVTPSLSVLGNRRERLQALLRQQRLDDDDDDDIALRCLMMCFA